MDSESITLRNELRPGDVGYIVWLHGTLYAREYGWDHTFEAYVAGPLAEFAKAANPRERIWIAEADGEIVGCIALVEVSESEAQLRWLLLHPSVRGRGLGKKLMSELVAFARAQNYQSILLWTEKSLTAAASLYRAFNFERTEEVTHQLWGTTVTEERYDLKL